jgi:hypothetical protein
MTTPASSTFEVRVLNWSQGSGNLLSSWSTQLRIMHPINHECVTREAALDGILKFNTIKDETNPGFSPTCQVKQNTIYINWVVQLVEYEMGIKNYSKF